jgi:hypothetical protein
VPAEAELARREGRDTEPDACIIHMI